MLTRVHVRRLPSGRWLRTTRARASTTWWARWSEVTVRSWEGVLAECSSPLRPGDVEWGCWRRLLRGTNLGGGDATWAEDLTPRGTLRGVREFYPAWVPRALVGPFLASTGLTPIEEAEIRAQVTRLASGPGVTLREVHPLVRIALDAERLFKRVGIPWAQDVLALSPRTHRGLTLVAQILDESETAEASRLAATREARRVAGRGPPG